jgi:hypothetical protein
VKDFTGATDTQAFPIRINAPRPVVITNQSEALSPGTVGQFRCCGNLFADSCRCPSKAHEREHLGIGGHRVLVSRDI